MSGLVKAQVFGMITMKSCPPAHREVTFQRLDRKFKSEMPVEYLSIAAGAELPAALSLLVIPSSQREAAICSCHQVSPHRKYGWQKEVRGQPQISEQQS